MKMMKKCLALLLVLTMVFALAACSKTETTEQASTETEQTSAEQTQSTEEKKDKLTIGYVVANPTWQGWLIITNGVHDAAEELADEVEYVEMGLASMQDLNAYINALEDLRTMGADAIVMGGCNMTLAANIDEFIESSGIPIIEVDSPSGATKTYNMSIDNEAGGAMAAAWMGEKLGGKGTVVSVNGRLTDTSGIGRKEGFAKYMNEHYPDIEIFDVATEWQQEQALNGVDDAFASLGTIDGIFCGWDGAAVVVSNTLVERGLTGKTLLCGFDGAADALQLMKKGEIDADVAQPLYGMGYEGFKTAYALAKGETPENAKIALDTKLVTTDTLDSWIEEGHLQSFFE